MKNFLSKITYSFVVSIFAEFRCKYYIARNLAYNVDHTVCILWKLKIVPCAKILTFHYLYYKPFNLFHR
jgi:hypothetical protein